MKYSFIEHIKQPTDTSYAWNPQWIQKYESYNSIIRKFCFANEITPIYFKKVFSSDSQLNILKRIIGFDEEEYINNQKKLICSRIGTHINGESVFRNDEWICNKCYINGLHSIFHQVSIFTNCIYHIKWGNRRERIREISIRKRRYGQLSEKNPSRPYFEPNHSKLGRGYRDIGKSLDHYIFRLLSNHKKCISFTHPIDQRSELDRVKGIKNCFIAKFFSELLTRQGIMETEYRMMYPRAQEDRTTTYHRYVLNEFIRNSKYTYDTLYKQFHISLNFFQNSIILSETNSFHVYLDVFLRLIKILMEEKISLKLQIFRF